MFFHALNNIDNSLSFTDLPPLLSFALHLCTVPSYLHTACTNAQRLTAVHTYTAQNVLV